MTALNVIQTEDAVHFYTDGGAYVARDGQFILAGYANKIFLSPHGRFAVGASGSDYLDPIAHALANMPSITSAVAVGSEMINAGIRAGSESGRPSHPITLIIGGFDDNGNRQVWGWSYVSGDPSKVDFERFNPGLMSFRPEVVGFFEEVQASGKPFETADDLGLAVLEEQRNRVYSTKSPDVSGHIVGLCAIATTIQFDRITTRVLKRWPDMLGFPINLQSEIQEHETP